MDPAPENTLYGDSPLLPTHDEALKLAYETHGPILLNYLLRLTTGNRAMAEDILQETLVRAWNHPEARTADGEWSRGWLFTVARRIAIDHIRVAQVRPTEQLDERIEDHHTTADDIDRLINTREVRDAVARLPERLRSALIEIYFQEHSVAEAAQNLAVPEGTVKSRTFYALRALHEDLVAHGFTV
ncbi:sigma-70 family RNA polymerase sigma factor [Actinoplanes derwentensis]|uniref:RNA polymerase sigma-70 factor, ECF subfamily n=1 Tax=Actinoplanes derwentensis TaxID=113562 RepID=A0A1H2C8G1_9ACTN|nr:sigma-70 family RNA polymerase sigma factor [Actinoplanes derwentensis]GID86538.1 RNA polymerase sigma factor SigL [Actinoplanes derwentensis]SDT66552.1 RNA polymerase sigma-70 factor, ECF subfamily [Actinoplanes derwentensis]